LVVCHLKKCLTKIITMKKIILNLCFLTVTLLSYTSWAQNPIWIIAPNYLKFNPDEPAEVVPLPTGTNPDFSYQGQPANYSSNAIADANGNLKCFIIDGRVYDNEGFFIGDFGTVVDLIQDSQCYGRSELAVVPDPGNCERLYVFGIARVYEFGLKNDLPFYSIIDFSNYSYENNGRIGRVELATLIDDRDDTVRNGNGFISISKKRPDNSHLVFISESTKVKVYVLDQNGLTETTQFILPQSENNLVVRAEMELFENTTNPSEYKYKIAVPFYKELVITGGFPNEYIHAVYIAKLDQNGNVIPNSDIVLNYQVENNLETPFIKGLEFDETGRYLFISHNLNANYPFAIDYVDLLTMSTWQPIQNLAVNHFENSQIEYGIINNQPGLYVINSFAIGRITINNSVIGFNSSFFPIGISPSYMGTDVNGWFEYEKYKVYLLPDQIDGLNYESDFNYSYYDELSYSQSTNATWQPGLNNNPFTSGNTIYIKDELVIPAGVTLTIQNMRLEFAPQAKVIVKNGENGLNGGRLRLVGTTMTVDERCGSDLWQGIEVWGNQNELQGTPSNSKQGVLEILAGSKIENAHMGVLVSKVNTVQLNNDDQIIGFTFDDSYNGGLVIASNSTFTNNATGVYFRKYLPTGVVNNRSKFNNMTFNWTGLLKRPNFFISAHMELEETRGITISGCHFKNSNPQAFVSNFSSEYAIGSGIISRGSHIYVQADCATLTQPCNNQLPSVFENLLYGILGQQVQLQTINVEGCEFINNINGISVSNSSLARVVKNKFQVRSSEDFQSSGLILTNSSRFTVQENEFYEDAIAFDGSAKSYGIVVKNSGTANNVIYKNKFKNLYVGGQSEQFNAIEVNLQNSPSMPNFQMSGLTWICNNFENHIRKADLTVAGNINYFQGNAGLPVNSVSEAVKLGARNSFSMIGETNTFPHHDIMVNSSSPIIRYSHLFDLSHRPDAYSPQVILAPVLFPSDNPIYMTPNGCPSRLRDRNVIVFNDLLAQQTSINEQISAIDSRLKSGSELLELVQQAKNVSTIKNQLMAQSPYLSDEVMIAYMDRSPAAGHLKDVLVSNSPLTEPVKGRMMSMSIPVGIKNQILQAQNTNKVSVRQNSVWSKLQLEHEKDLIYNERLSLALMDTSATATMDLFIEILKEDETFSKDRERIKLLLETYISKGDRPSIDELLSEVIQDAEIAQEEKELFVIEDEIRFKEATCVALAESPETRSKLELWNDDETAPLNVKRKSKCILEIADKSVEMPVFEEVMPSSAMALMNNETTTVYSEYETISSVYPNPTSGEIFIDYPFEEEGTLLVHVYSINGQLVHSISKQSTNGEMIDLSHLNKGLYLLEVLLDGEKLGTHKVQIK
jgi:hypothetical protein